MRNIVTTAAVLAIVALAGCSTTSVKHAPSAPASSSQPAAASPAAEPSSSEPDLSGPLGSQYEVTTQDESGNDIKYDVTAVKLLDPARGSDEFEVPDSGKRFVGVKFEITGSGGYAHDNANSDALIQGSDGQTYDADFSSISAGTNFNSGDFGVTSGRTQSGWVTFQLPKGVSVAEIQWQPNSFSDQQPAVWTVH
jgi:hypothetical protein